MGLLRSALNCAVMAIGLFSGSVAATAAELDRTIQFDIPAQPLESALIEFSKQANIPVVVAQHAADGMSAPALHARVAADAALKKLLNATGLLFREVDGTVTITPPHPATSDATVPTPSRQVMDRLPLTDQLNNTLNPSGAQQRLAARDTNALQEVTVTGTHIRGVTELGAPSLTITRQDIDESGISNIGTTGNDPSAELQRLHDGGALGTGGNPLTGANTDNATSIDLRGLGPQSTLTLVDGQRVAGSVQGRAVDVSMIPLSMVDHVDVVTGGASSIYGADAVGGVANIVLRHSYEGADTAASYGGTSYGGGQIAVQSNAGARLRRRERNGWLRLCT